MLAALAVPAHAQLTDRAARELAVNIVRSELQSTVHFKSDQFLGVQRDEELEESLAIAAGGRIAPRFAYKLSPTGYEVREKSIFYHVWTDVDVQFIVMVDPADGSTYRLHGFGVAESLAEFEKLMGALRVRVSNPDQAEYLAEFYRKVNPENLSSSPISSLLELKQAAERQCFDVGEKVFNAWWQHAKSLYATLSFKQRVSPHGGGFLVEWIVLSSPSRENCGGAPLRAGLGVGSDGHLSRLTVSPLDR